MEINLEKVNNFVYNVIASNGKNIGKFELDVDGYFYFWDNKDSGAWSSYSLRLIADKLDGINKPFKENVDNYFEQERKDFEEREKELQEKEIKFEVETLKYQLSAEKDKTETIQSIALGLVRNTEYRKTIFDSENPGGTPVIDGQGYAHYPLPMNKNYTSSEIKE